MEREGRSLVRTREPPSLCPGGESEARLPRARGSRSGALGGKRNRRRPRLGDVRGAQHRGRSPRPHPRCLLRLPRAAHGDLLQRPERQVIQLSFCLDTVEHSGFFFEQSSLTVWDKSENGDWHCTASWKTHSGSVWRVTWAHPEFGQVLASCSFDRTAVVWEEIVGESNDKLRGQSHWVKRTTLVDSRTSVTDVKFAPKHMGLMLATCSADGVVRIYEAPDVMNLSQWSLQHEISCKLSCSCISWNPSR
ncbi:nucleoporin SEH1 isoform X1 [Chrysemys picta bellii]|uniref:nucleoporin SEH1 isoform X1 n=1 Tax=Chrysemys picta bellii TaxID=8478 RepID=UPI0032B2A98E